MCDGMSQCQDRSDEMQCTKQTEGCVHHCDRESRCLPTNLLCDGERDCLDGTDEANCGRWQGFECCALTGSDHMNTSHA